jgi:hypothetical protein
VLCIFISFHFTPNPKEIASVHTTGQHKIICHAALVYLNFQSRCLFFSFPGEKKKDIANHGHNNGRNRSQKTPLP